MATAFGRQSQVFTPTQISGCALWLDGADPNNTGIPPANNASITTWVDKSGNGRDFTTGVSPSFIRNSRNNLGVVRFASGNYLQSASVALFSSASSGGSFFFIFQTTSNEGQKFLLTYQNQVSGTYCQTESEIGIDTGNTTGSGNFGIHRGCSYASIAPANTIANSTYYMMGLLLLTSGNSPSNVNIYQNANSLSVSNDNIGYYNAGSYPNGNNSRRLILGARSLVGNPSPDGFFTGDIAEVIWFSGPLSDTERQQIEGYLAWKWGLVANLPSTHPYKSTPLYQLPPLPLVPAPTRIINSKPGPSLTFPTTNKQGKSYFIDNPLWFAFGIPTSNFSASLPITLAGNASYTSNLLQLTPNSGSQRGTAFYQTQVRILKFSTQFNLRFDSTQADGATFCIQNSSSNALGTSGGGLGYGGITNSVAIRFDSWNGGGGQFSTDILTGGTVSPDQAGSGILNTTFGLTAGTTWNFLINASYDGTTLSYTIRNFSNRNQSFSSNRTIDIGTTIGSSNAWIGFTSATGGATETCSILSWNWSNSK